MTALRLLLIVPLLVPLPFVTESERPADPVAGSLFHEGPAPEATTLAALRADPARYLGRTLSVNLQFRSTLDGWNPFLTRFTPRAWLGFGAWADESFTWEARVFDDPCARLFARRGSRAAEALARLLPYDRCEAVVTVDSVFLDEPWIEVLSVRRLEGQVGEGTILHVDRARRLFAEGRVDLALEQLDRAKSGPIPAHARQEIERLRAGFVAQRAAVEAALSVQR